MSVPPEWAILSCRKRWVFLGFQSSLKCSAALAHQKDCWLHLVFFQCDPLCCLCSQAHTMFITWPLFTWSSVVHPGLSGVFWGARGDFSTHCTLFSHSPFPLLGSLKLLLLKYLLYWTPSPFSLIAKLTLSTALCCTFLSSSSYSVELHCWKSHDKYNFCLTDFFFILWICQILIQLSSFLES